MKLDITVEERTSSLVVIITEEFIFSFSLFYFLLNLSNFVFKYFSILIFLFLFFFEIFKLIIRCFLILKIFNLQFDYHRKSVEKVDA